MNSDLSGSGVQSRYQAVREIHMRVPRKFVSPCDEKGKPQRVSEFFGCNTFDLIKMKEKLPKEVFVKLLLTIEAGKKLDGDIANSVAHAMKEWAMSHGASHFCHWFQPQTGATAEKHDAFLTFDENHNGLEKFSGSQLIQSEPDASSFPSGGMRTTFEARGYTAWDPSSPVFIMEHTNGSTLCIPSVFISYHGDALDEKTALLRSMDILSHNVCKILDLIGDTEIQRVVPTLGAEQEYFLIDRGFYHLRPDLVMTGRTLVGAEPPKGQQLEDHYFGSIPERVQAFMSEMEFELFKLGVPIKTRHNEVAPNQFETAPIFEEANLSTDHNQLTMEVLKKVSQRHGFAVLLHEKPFAGINGSGKHNNWSMMISSSGSPLHGTNLLEPGKTPHQNLRFLVCLMAVLKGVHQNAGLLRAGIASAGNDHRLGANEAPPAIISVFLGDLLNQILDELESGAAKEKNAEMAVIRLGISKLPEVMRDNTDRNRTSPFAFTGNKFEFRAVGASASTAFPITLLNAAVAEGFSTLTQYLLNKARGGAKPTEAQILEVICETIRETKAIRFEGNNYSEEWLKEAVQRGLPNLKKTPEALAELNSLQAKKTLCDQGIFTQNELRSRYHVRVERYVKNILIEGYTLLSLVDTLVLPAGFQYHGQLAAAAKAAQSLKCSAPQVELLSKLSSLLEGLLAHRASLNALLHRVETLATEDEKAKFLANEVNSLMEQARTLCDQLEAISSDSVWPLPKYREMLFLV